MSVVRAVGIMSTGAATNRVFLPAFLSGAGKSGLLDDPATMPASKKFLIFGVLAFGQFWP